MAKDERKILRGITFGPNELGEGQYDSKTFGPDEEDELEEFLDAREGDLEEGDETKDEILERLERTGAVIGFADVPEEELETQGVDQDANRRHLEQNPELENAEEAEGGTTPRRRSTAKKAATKRATARKRAAKKDDE